MMLLIWATETWIQEIFSDDGDKMKESWKMISIEKWSAKRSIVKWRNQMEWKYEKE